MREAAGAGNRARLCQVIFTIFTTSPVVPGYNHLIERSSRERAMAVARPRSELTGEIRREEFEQRVRDALARLYDPAYLQRHPLARLARGPGPTGSASVGQSLRLALIEAIDALRPADPSSG